MGKIKSILSKLFCFHDYELTTWHESYDAKCNLRHSVRIYKCSKCGKLIEVDGRFDSRRY